MPLTEIVGIFVLMLAMFMLGTLLGFIAAIWNIEARGKEKK